MMNENNINQNEILNNQNQASESKSFKTEEELLREEETVGENDIVIEEDFQINLDVADISAESLTFGNKDNENNTNSQPTELGTEQSGNITF